MLNHVLLPCKMNSTRIPRKNLRTVGGRSLLELTIDRFQAWYPEATIWVATEDAEVCSIAAIRNCLIYNMSSAETASHRGTFSLFAEWLGLRQPSERCLLYHLTSPFTFRSELEAAINDPRPFCTSASVFKIQEPGSPLMSQDIPLTVSLEPGNFLCAWGKTPMDIREHGTSIIPVNRLSAIDINTPEDLRLADFIAARMPLSDFDDVGATA